MPTTQDPLRKAAILLRSLPAEQRTRLLSKLEAVQAAAVAETMNKLDEVADSEREAIAAEFQSVEGGSPVERSESSGTFEFLHDLTPEEVYSLLSDERSQTIAMVLSFLPPRLAGEVMDKFPPDRQFAVVCRVATLGKASPEIIHDVEDTLKRRLSGDVSRLPIDRGVANVIRILHAMAPANERRLLNAMTDADPQLVRKIRRGMFGVDVPIYPESGLIEAAG